MNVTAQRILDFWFSAEEGALPMQRWFTAAPSFDERIRTEFGAAVDEALDGGFKAWEADVHARLALILLLDQFPRNIHRRTARAFEGDERALHLARQTLQAGEDKALEPLERMFLLMPFQHAEDMRAQEEGVGHFASLVHEAADDASRGVLESAADYARRHCEIISRFGRFPYRNDVLERETTAAEREWLASGVERFGQ